MRKGKRINARRVFRLKKNYTGKFSIYLHATGNIHFFGLFLTIA